MKISGLGLVLNFKSDAALTRGNKDSLTLAATNYTQLNMVVEVARADIRSTDPSVVSVTARGQNTIPLQVPARPNPRSFFSMTPTECSVELADVVGGNPGSCSIEARGVARRLQVGIVGAFACTKHVTIR